MLYLLENFPEEYNYMMKHRNYKNVWEFPDEFPSVEIIEAFSRPETKDLKSIKVETPNFKNLSSFCESILKLSPHEVEFIIEPL